MIKLKINKKLEGKLVVKGEDVNRVINLIIKDNDVVVCNDDNKSYFTNLFECKCGETIGATDNYCSGCGRRISYAK